MGSNTRLYHRNGGSGAAIAQATLGEIGHRLGRKALADVANTAKPDTILGWYRRLVARKFDGSKQSRYPGRPRVQRELEELVVRMARDNRDWGYDRTVGALRDLGYTLSDETVGNILRRHGIAPSPQRKRTTTWKEFIDSHLAVLAGTDFFSVEVLTLRGLVTYYVLFFIHLETRRDEVAGIDRLEEPARFRVGKSRWFLAGMFKLARLEGMHLVV